MQGIIWITGASQGIGYALVLYYLAQGYRVYASARHCDRLMVLARQNPHSQGQLIPLPVDVTDADAVNDAVARIASDVATERVPIQTILNAGTHQPEAAIDFKASTVERLCQLNLIGTSHCIEALIPLMRKRQQGQIAIVASLAGYRGLPEAAAYGASKAALINLAESLRLELHRERIDIRLINPGFVRTPLTDRNQFKMPQLISAQQAAGYIGRGLAGSAFEIRFPGRFATLLALLRLLPARLYLPLVRQLTHR